MEFGIDPGSPIQLEQVLAINPIRESSSQQSPCRRSWKVVYQAYRLEHESRIRMLSKRTASFVGCTMPVIALAMAAACSSAATIKNAATAPSSSHSSAGNMRPFEERCAGRTSGDYMSADGCRFDLHDGMNETPYFATRSDAIDAEAKKALDLVAKIQKKYGFRFNIVGHAANCDSEAVNQSLSLRRAENVKSELLALGVRDDQIVSVSGMGSTQSNSNTPPSCADHFNDRVNLDLVDLDQRTSPP